MASLPGENHSWFCNVLLGSVMARFSSSLLLFLSCIPQIQKIKETKFPSLYVDGSRCGLQVISVRGNWESGALVVVYEKGKRPR